MFTLHQSVLGCLWLHCLQVHAGPFTPEPGRLLRAWLTSQAWQLPTTPCFPPPAAAFPCRAGSPTTTRGWTTTCKWPGGRAACPPCASCTSLRRWPPSPRWPRCAMLRGAVPRCVGLLCRAVWVVACVRSVGERAAARCSALGGVQLPACTGSRWLQPPPALRPTLWPACPPRPQEGGLGDVVTALGRAVQDEGHDVEVILPKYDCINYNHVKVGGCCAGGCRWAGAGGCWRVGAGGWVLVGAGGKRGCWWGQPAGGNAGLGGGWEGMGWAASGGLPDNAPLSPATSDPSRLLCRRCAFPICACRACPALLFPPACCLQELRQGKDFFVDNVQVKIWKGKVEGEQASKQASKRCPPASRCRRPWKHCRKTKF